MSVFNGLKLTKNGFVSKNEISFACTPYQLFLKTVLRDQGHLRERVVIAKALYNYRRITS